MSDIPEALRQRLRALKTPTLRVERITHETLTTDEPARVEWIVSVPYVMNAGAKTHVIADLRWHVRRSIDVGVAECLRAARCMREAAEQFPVDRLVHLATAAQYDSEAEAFAALSREFDALWPEAT